jgi:chromate transport protein ChrA
MKAVVLPPMTLAAVTLALALCFSGGLPGMLAQIITSSLMMAYALVGFAVLHTVTLTLRSRALWLSCVYAVVLVFLWPIVAMIGIGIADTVFGLRQRYLQRHTPPPLAPTS